MAKDRPKRADAPVRKLDFVNNPPEGAGTAAPQPLNHALAQQGALCAEGMVIVNSRGLVQEALRKPAIFSSSDLVEQGKMMQRIPAGELRLVGQPVGLRVIKIRGGEPPLVHVE